MEFERYVELYTKGHHLTFSISRLATGAAKLLVFDRRSSVCKTLRDKDAHDANIDQLAHVYIINMCYYVNRYVCLSNTHEKQGNEHLHDLSMTCYSQCTELTNVVVATVRVSCS